MQDKDLDQILARAAGAPPPQAPGLLDRVLADALAEQARFAAPAPSTKPMAPAGRGLAAALDWLAATLGGTPMLAGVCAAALVGTALGYLEPSMLDLLTGGDIDTVDLFPEVEFLMTEG